MPFEKETIPDDATLYCFVHKANVDYKRGNVPRAAAFQNTPKEGDNLSSDWSKYSSAEETRARVGKQFKFNSEIFKNPDDFCVLQMNVGILRSEDYKQKIEHDPIFNDPEIVGTPNNQAHSIIIGEKDEEVRLKMQSICSWVIEPPPQ
jgi:hypothetical protein